MGRTPSYVLTGVPKHNRTKRVHKDAQLRGIEFDFQTSKTWVGDTLYWILTVLAMLRHAGIL